MKTQGIMIVIISISKTMTFHCSHHVSVNKTKPNRPHYISRGSMEIWHRSNNFVYSKDNFGSSLFHNQRQTRIIDTDLVSGRPLLCHRPRADWVSDQFSLPKEQSLLRVCVLILLSIFRHARPFSDFGGILFKIQCDGNSTVYTF